MSTDVFDVLRRTRGVWYDGVRVYVAFPVLVSSVEPLAYSQMLRKQAYI